MGVYSTIRRVKTGRTSFAALGEELRHVDRRFCVCKRNLKVQWNCLQRRGGGQSHPPRKNSSSSIWGLVWQHTRESTPARVFMPMTSNYFYRLRRRWLRRRRRLNPFLNRRPSMWAPDNLQHLVVLPLWYSVAFLKLDYVSYAAHLMLVVHQKVLVARNIAPSLLHELFALAADDRCLLHGCPEHSPGDDSRPRAGHDWRLGSVEPMCS